MFQGLFGASLRSHMVSPERALAGRPERPFSLPARHRVFDTPLEGPFPIRVMWSTWVWGVFGVRRRSYGSCRG